MNCNTIQELLPVYADNAANQNERKAVEAHIKSCAGCGRLLKELRACIREVKDLDTVQAPEGFVERVMTRVREDRKRPVFVRFSYRFAGVAAALLVVVLLTSHYPGFLRDTVLQQPHIAKHDDTSETEKSAVAAKDSGVYRERPLDAGEGTLLDASKDGDEGMSYTAKGIPSPALETADEENGSPAGNTPEGIFGHAPVKTEPVSGRLGNELHARLMTSTAGSTEGIYREEALPDDESAAAAVQEKTLSQRQDSREKRYLMAESIIGSYAGRILEKIYDDTGKIAKVKAAFPSDTNTAALCMELTTFCSVERSEDNTPKKTDREVICFLDFSN